jgi:hypothetical protein
MNEYKVQRVRDAYAAAGRTMLPSEERTLVAEDGLTNAEQRIADRVETKVLLEQAADVMAEGRLMAKVIEARMLDMPLALRQAAARHLLLLDAATAELIAAVEATE